ncbi:BTB/POZ and MATH domain-containing protein 1 [Sorghum bicolor]|uniref:BTB/POZ and MATH domain-containing protein 1 n=1 Tax=Sorghum bicolor TaxID=4558 RepID=UPI0001A87A7E|nr:BTB/POZ and MATH domain-containing protein 1 [Sorghum bicolor]|eukprot:XP_002444989.1 BTB/POZ and MATH domain-containing protein 1 [Sorghum bicolor]
MAPSPCTVRGTHQFEIVGYSLIKGFAAGEYVRSGSFAVGGYRWSVRFYPGGFSAPHRAYVSAFVKLTSKNARAWARYDLRLVDRCTGLSRSVHHAAEPVVFVYSAPPPPGKCKPKRGARKFMPRSELEASAYLRDDRLTIECVVDVVADEARVPEAVALCKLRLPPSDLAKHLGELLLNQQHGDQAADVTLAVQGEIFRAHRVVLAARSPVFMAELFGDMKEKAMDRIAVDDMQPVVFRALLHFIYTDVLLLPGDLDGDDDYREMVRHLLEAADRYGMERLKLICESILCRSVDGATVETTLALADRHYCEALTDVCLQFKSLELDG